MPNLYQELEQFENGVLINALKQKLRPFRSEIHKILPIENEAILIESKEEKKSKDEFILLLFKIQQDEAEVKLNGIATYLAAQADDWKANTASWFASWKYTPVSSSTDPLILAAMERMFPDSMQITYKNKQYWMAVNAFVEFFAEPENINSVKRFLSKYVLRKALDEMAAEGFQYLNIVYQQKIDAPEEKRYFDDVENKPMPHPHFNPTDSENEIELIQQYHHSCEKYKEHLFNSIESELKQVLKNRNRQFHGIPFLNHLNQISKINFYQDADYRRGVINRLIEMKKFSPGEPEYSFEDAIHGEFSVLKTAIKKAQIMQDLTDTLTNESKFNSQQRIEIFQDRVKQFHSELTHHRHEDTFFNNFLRGLGVFGAALLGLAFFGVGAIVAGWYTHYSLFVKTDGHKFTKEIDEITTKAVDETLNNAMRLI